MKKINNILLSLWVSIILIASGCETLLDVDPDYLILPEENQLNSPSDTLYSMVGIFTQLEKLADRYVLLGELRGDLMSVSQNANQYLQEINKHEISQNNPYNKVEDYYSVINNCNYVINNIDTALVLKSEKVMYKNFAAAKAIRAWTYLQLVLNYGKAKYYNAPILDIKDVDSYVEYSLQELMPFLILDLELWKDVEKPGNFSLGEDLTSSSSLYFPIKLLLGDLYLWRGEYENAAIHYHEMMVENYYTIHEEIRSTWTVENGVFVSREIDKTLWPYLHILDFPLQITLIASSTEFGKSAELDSLSWFNDEIIPSPTSIENWNKQIYYHSATVLKEGDLRGDLGSYISSANASFFQDEEYTPNFTSTNYKILKYRLMTEKTARAVCVYRTGVLYLRYAEAVNRAGKPNLAFATLKNGLNSDNLAIDTIVPRKEKYIQYTDTSGIFLDYVDFEDIPFDYNIGVHARGCGNVELSNDFIIPSLNSLEDSIVWVEDKIIEELALETAFEGNRFHDLMRIAMRRNDLSYLANKVSEKYYNNQEAIRSKLMDENNWYLH